MWKFTKKKFFLCLFMVFISKVTGIIRKPKNLQSYSFFKKKPKIGVKKVKRGHFFSKNVSFWGQKDPIFTLKSLKNIKRYWKVSINKKIIFYIRLNFLQKSPIKSLYFAGSFLLIFKIYQKNRKKVNFFSQNNYYF